jgi:hypothetical protein
VFKNRAQRKTGNKTEEVTGRGTTLYSEELHGCYTASNIVKVIKSRRMREAWHVSGMGGKRDASRVLVREPEGKRCLGRPT